jgi:hypothetical protein
MPKVLLGTGISREYIIICLEIFAGLREEQAV